jgi:hypothetical protein
MCKHVIVSAAALLLASTIAASAGGIGFGITIGPGAFAPGLRSAPPPREYRPRARSYREEPSRPRRQSKQNSDDDAKAADTSPAAKGANESSSIASLGMRSSEPDLHGENSSIAGGPRPTEPAPSPTVTVQLENSSIAAALRPAQASLPAPVAVQAESPVQQPVSSEPLCSRYYPTASRTVQVPCD